jgi:hypothetical protein
MRLATINLQATLEDITSGSCKSDDDGALMATIGAAMMLKRDAENPPSKTALVLSRCQTVCGQSSRSHPLSKAIRTPCGRFRVLKTSALFTITMVIGRKSAMVTLFTRAAFYIGTSMFHVGGLMGDQSTLRQRDPRKK